jgi:hypothetical protein
VATSLYRDVATFVYPRNLRLVQNVATNVATNENITLKGKLCLYFGPFRLFPCVFAKLSDGGLSQEHTTVSLQFGTNLTEKAYALDAGICSCRHYSVN